MKSNSDISRPVHDSFRHTGHGSPFGPSWGSPTFIDPAYLEGNVEMRGELELKFILKSLFVTTETFTGNTLDNKGLDRRRKCSSYQVKERKSNAVKQFAYNKLVNERAESVRVKPNRPPQPKINNTQNGQEGVLIDLSPDGSESIGQPSNQREVSNNSAKSHNNSVCILDAPIDIPTEGDLYETEMNAMNTVSVSRAEPPPYQMPPTYSNTIEFSQLSASSSPLHSINKPADRNDPFDTSAINELANGTNVYQSTNLYGNVSSASESPHHQNLAAICNGLYKKDNMNMDTSTPSSKGAISKQKFNASCENRSPPGSAKKCLNYEQAGNLSTPNSYGSYENQSKIANDLLSNSPTTATATTITTTDPTSLSDLMNDELELRNDSMTVNLSALSLNDTTNSDKRLDESFIAELEKDMYKNESSTSNLNVNTSQNYSKGDVQKDNYISAILSQDNTVKTFNTSPSSSSSYMTQKINNNDQRYQSTASVSNAGQSRYALSDLTAPTVAPKQINTSQNDTNAVINQIWYETISRDNYASSQNINENIYSNSSSIQKNHNYVAVANKPPNASASIQKNLYSLTPNKTQYASSFYDTVPPTPASFYGQVPTASQTSNQIYSTTQPLQPVIYDEVSADDYLRPHRPAPLAPPQLSAQQIQRRLEKHLYQQQQQSQQQQGIYSSSNFSADYQTTRIDALIKDLGSSVSESDARLALNAANWDHNMAVRHYKIEQLLR